MKLLNTFSKESNDEIIKVDILEADKGIVININGTTMDVFINSEEFYSKFDREEYKYIPSHLRSFIEKHLCNYSDEIIKDKSEIKCDLTIEGEDYFCIIPTKRAKKDYFVLRNYLIDYKQLGEDSNIKIDMKEESIKYQEFLNKINSIGYKMQLSHNGNEYDNYFDLAIPINNFNLERVKYCVKLWQEYNKYLINTYLN